MIKLEVFDPPMCCATGICGNSVDPTLVTFASDLEWLKKQGVDVIRHGLSFEPAAFVKNEEIKNTLNKEGNDCLPIIVVGDKIVSKGCYPFRDELATMCGIEFNEEEAPPIHREENCCCGIDCDCSAKTTEEAKTNSSECDFTDAAAEDNCFCGPECDCHQSPVSDNSKKILFIAVILIMAVIIAVKFCCKAGAAENLYKNLASISQISPSEEVAFIYVPTKTNEKMSSEIKDAMISSKNTLKSKNILAYLYIMSPKSSDYVQVASKTTPPAILTIYKGKGKNYVSGTINQTRLLQSYIASSRDGGCGAGCPCHKK